MVIIMYFLFELFFHAARRKQHAEEFSTIEIDIYYLALPVARRTHVCFYLLSATQPRRPPPRKNIFASACV